MTHVTTDDVLVADMPRSFTQGSFHKKSSRLCCYKFNFFFNSEKMLFLSSYFDQVLQENA